MATGLSKKKKKNQKTTKPKNAKEPEIAWVDITHFLELILAAPYRKLQIISPGRIIFHLCHDTQVQWLLQTLKLPHEKSSLQHPTSAPGKFTCH